MFVEVSLSFNLSAIFVWSRDLSTPTTPPRTVVYSEQLLHSCSIYLIGILPAQSKQLTNRLIKYDPGLLVAFRCAFFTYVQIFKKLKHLLYKCKPNGQHWKQFGRNGHFSYDQPTKIANTYFFVKTCHSRGVAYYGYKTLENIILWNYTVLIRIEKLFGRNISAQHTISCHYRPVCETPFGWRFAGGSIVARIYVLTLYDYISWAHIPITCYYEDSGLKVQINLHLVRGRHNNKHRLPDDDFSVYYVYRRLTKFGSLKSKRVTF